jgi:hypothetical protein
MANSKTASKKTTKKTSKKEPKLKPFCGAKPIPKGHRLGSMKECVDLKQVRYYGIQKIDNKLADTLTNKPEKKMLMSKLSSLMGKATRLLNEIKGCKNAEEKHKKKGEYESLRKEVLILNDKIKKMK